MKTSYSGSTIYIESFLEKFTKGKLGAHFMLTLIKNV